MLENITTGYEAQFDFPAMHGARRICYLLASVPRAGSTYFSHMLWRTGCLGAPLEYLNFEPLGPYGYAADDALQQQRLWTQAVRNRTSPNGVFGLKVFPTQLQRLQRTNPPLLSAVIELLLPRGRHKLVVYLRRRDHVAQTVSLARAAASGIWRSEQEQGGSQPVIEYSQERLEAASRGIRFQEDVWERMFDDLRLEPLRLWHEDCIAAPAEAARQVADYLKVELDPTAMVKAPEIVKQAAGPYQAWYDRFATSIAS